MNLARQGLQSRVRVDGERDPGARMEPLHESPAS